MAYIENNVAVKAYCGTVGTGKTEKLVQRVAQLVAQGVQADAIRVFAASPAAAQALKARIAGVLGTGADQPQVTTPIQFALDLLDCDEAFAFSGRRAHVLADFEYDFFFEDMRVTSVDQKRLRGMLDFFYRGWTEMSDDDPSWLITEAEVNIQAFARKRLAMVEAYHPCEVTATAVRFLQANAQTLDGLRTTYVLADDYRAMSRASQRLCQMLAGEGLEVTWDTVGSLKGEERYGYAEGLAELVADAAVDQIDLTEFSRGVAAYHAVGNLFKQESMAQAKLPESRVCSGMDIEVQVVSTLDKEAGRVAQTIKEALDAGMAPEDVFVCVPKDSWGGRIRKALVELGVPVSVLRTKQIVHGDVRDVEKCEAAIVYNALRLVANPQDALAWRCWCGFGDFLARSSGFSVLCDAMGENGSNLPQALADLAQGVAHGENASLAVDRIRLVQGYEAGQALVAAAEGMGGMQLLQLVAKQAIGLDEVPAEVLEMVGDVCDTDTAADFAARAEAFLYNRTFADSAVRVGGADLLTGQSPKLLVLCGLVNGLWPSRRYFDLQEATIDEQAKMHTRLIEQLVQVCGKAGERLVLSGFERADIVDSEMLKLMSVHVRLRNGKRVCDYNPSVVIEYVTGQKTGYVR